MDPNYPKLVPAERRLLPLGIERFFDWRIGEFTYDSCDLAILAAQILNRSSPMKSLNQLVGNCKCPDVGLLLFDLVPLLLEHADQAVGTHQMGGTNDDEAGGLLLDALVH